MNWVATLVALLLLVTTSWTLGTAALRPLPLPGLRQWERLALHMTLGLGLCALLLSLLTLFGLFAASPWILTAVAVGGCWYAGRQWRSNSASSPPTDHHIAPPCTSRISVALAATAVLACLGAISPVTDDDALAYVIPIAQHLADSGELRVWSDQARSMWPQSQPVLLAFMLLWGSTQLGTLTALQLLLALGTASALARRVCERSSHVAIALVIAFGAPTVAFLVASAKEDLWLVAATSATALCLAGNNTRAEIAAAGLFAGVAAAAKYPGAGVLLGAFLWVLLGVRERRFQSAAILVAAATLTGGLWYALNLWRYGNPVAPFVLGASGTPLDAATMRSFNDSFGVPRTLLNFVLIPLRIFIDSDLFIGRSGWFNPLAWLGVGALCIPRLRQRHAPLLFIAGVLYVGWFFSLQNSRLLLPAMVLLAPAAADLLLPFCTRQRWLLVPAGLVVAVSLGIVAAVGVLRTARYAGNPAGFLLQHTPNYADITWMNRNLDPALHRVASDHKALGYLQIPWINLDPTYALEFALDEYDDQQRLLTALRRQGITHLFANADNFTQVRDQLTVVYQNPVSRLGGRRFFREPPTEATVVYELLPAPTPNGTPRLYPSAILPGGL